MKLHVRIFLNKRRLTNYRLVHFKKNISVDRHILYFGKVFLPAGLSSDGLSSGWFFISVVFCQIVFHRRGGGGVGVFHRRSEVFHVWGGGGSFERMVFHENGFSSG